MTPSVSCPRTASLGRPAARTLGAATALACALALTFAYAQPVRHQDVDAGIAFPVPAGWSLAQRVGDDGERIFELTGHDGGGTLVIVRTPVSPIALEGLRALGPASVLEAWDGFAEEVAGARVERIGQRTVAGRDVGRVDYVAPGLRGALLSLVRDDAVFTIVSFASEAASVATDAALTEVLDGFALVEAAAAEPQEPAASSPTRSSAPNPLAGAGPSVPPAGGNPLLAPAPANPATAAPHGRYLESFRGTDPGAVFGGVLDVGPSGAWNGALDGSAYVLRNEADPNAVRYYFARTLPGISGPLSRASVGIDVQLAPMSPFAAAGLVFDFDPDTGHYLAFTVTPQGYAVLQNSGSGLTVLANERADAVVSGGRNRLELRPQPDRVAMLVNGRQIITLESTTAFVGGVGIVAIGSGTFAFRDLEVVGP